MLLMLREQEYRSCLFYAFFKADRFRSRNGSMIYSPLFLEDKSRHSTSQLLLLSHIFDGLVYSLNIATFDIMASKECRIFNRDVPLSVRSISSYLCYRNPHFWPQPKRSFLCNIFFLVPNGHSPQSLCEFHLTSTLKTWKLTCAVSSVILLLRMKLS